MVVDHGGGQAQPDCLADRVAQLHRGQRVEAEFPERPLDVNGGGGVVPEDGRHVGTDDVQQVRQPVGVGQIGQHGGIPWLGRRGGHRALVGLGERGEQRSGPGHGIDRGEPVPVDVGDHEVALVVVEDLPQHRESESRLHRWGALTQQLFGGLVVHHATATPGPPGDGGGGTALATAPVGEGVEPGVAGAIRGLSSAAPDGRAGGEENECVERPVGEQLVKVGRAEHLGPAHVGEGVKVGLAERGGFGQHPGGVKDSGQVVADPVEKRGGRLAVGHVAGDDLNAGQTGGEVGGAGGGRAASAGQDDPVDTLVE